MPASLPTDGNANGTDSTKSDNNSILSMSTRFPLRMPKTSGALASSKDVMTLPSLSSAVSLPSLGTELDDDESGIHGYLMDARDALNLSSRNTSAYDFNSRKEGLLSTPKTTSSRLRHDVEDMHLDSHDKEIFRSSLLRSLASDPPATIIDNTPTKLLTKREMEVLRAQCAEQHALEQVGGRDG